VRTRVLVLIFSGISVLSSPFARKPNPPVPSSQPQAASRAGRASVLARFTPPYRGRSPNITADWLQRLSEPSDQKDRGVAAGGRIWRPGTAASAIRAPQSRAGSYSHLGHLFPFLDCTLENCLIRGVHPIFVSPK
jgi:hypothetical protein